MKRAGFAAAMIAALIASACSTDSTEPELAPECRQTSEFGNYGCAVVTGRVLNGSGQALRGILVGPTPHLEGLSAFSAGTVETNAQGNFEVTFRRHLPRESTTGPDTASTYIRAVDPQTGVRDSVFLRIEIKPVGTAPAPNSTEIRLPGATGRTSSVSQR